MKKRRPAFVSSLIYSYTASVIATVAFAIAN
jgi:hypothetical protein